MSRDRSARGRTTWRRRRNQTPPAFLSLFVLFSFETPPRTSAGSYYASRDVVSKVETVMSPVSRTVTRDCIVVVTPVAPSRKSLKRGNSAPVRENFWANLTASRGVRVSAGRFNNHDLRRPAAPPAPPTSPRVRQSACRAHTAETALSPQKNRISSRRV